MPWKGLHVSEQRSPAPILETVAVARCGSLSQDVSFNEIKDPGTTGNFEIKVNGELLHSKRTMGPMPSYIPRFGCCPLCAQVMASCTTTQNRQRKFVPPACIQVVECCDRVGRCACCMLRTRSAVPKAADLSAVMRFCFRDLFEVSQPCFKAFYPENEGPGLCISSVVNALWPGQRCMSWSLHTS